MTCAIKERYGKGRVRVMRIHRDGDRHEVSQLSVKAMIEGDFARAYTHADNSTSVATDTIKNIVNVVARENTGLSNEEFCQVLAKRYLDTYPQIASVAISAQETKWSRLSFGGKPHPHSFVLDSNGKPLSSLWRRGGQTALSRHRGLPNEVDPVRRRITRGSYPRSETADGCAPQHGTSWNGRRNRRAIPRPCADSRHRQKCSARPTAEACRTAVPRARRLAAVPEIRKQHGRRTCLHSDELAHSGGYKKTFSGPTSPTARLSARWEGAKRHAHPSRSAERRALPGTA